MARAALTLPLLLCFAAVAYGTFLLVLLLLSVLLTGLHLLLHCVTAAAAAVRSSAARITCAAITQRQQRRAQVLEQTGTFPLEYCLCVYLLFPRPLFLSSRAAHFVHLVSCIGVVVIDSGNDGAIVRLIIGPSGTSTQSPVCLLLLFSYNCLFFGESRLPMQGCMPFN